MKNKGNILRNKNVSTKSLLCPDDFFSNLTLNHLLLDTSFFIDAIEDEVVFREFARKCKAESIQLVTIDPVVFEFIKGSKDDKTREARLKFINSFTQGYFLPIVPQVFEVYIPSLMKKYGKEGATVSLTDFMLASMCMHHSHDLCLLTKNTKDFPVSFFKLEDHFIFPNKKQRTLQVYAVYSYERINKKEEKGSF